MLKEWNREERWLKRCRLIVPENLGIISSIVTKKLNILTVHFGILNDIVKGEEFEELIFMV